MSDEPAAVATAKIMLKGAFFILKVVFKMLAGIFRFSARKLEERKQAQPGTSPQSGLRPQSAPSGFSEDKGVSVLTPGSWVYARFSGDQFYYRATINAVEGESANVTFYDNHTESVPLDGIKGVWQAIHSMKAMANWRNEGPFYECKVNSRNGNTLEVTYDKDGIVEQVAADQVRFV